MLLIIVVLLFDEDSQLGRALEWKIVQPIVDNLLRLTAGKIALYTSLIVGAGLFAWMAGPDGMVVMMMAAPETAAWLVTFDVAIYTDVLIASVLMSRQTSSLRNWGVRVLYRVRCRKRARRSAKSGAAKHSAARNDNDKEGDQRRVA